MYPQFPRAVLGVAVLPMLIIAVACSPAPDEGPGARTPEVGYVIVQPTRVTLAHTYPGRIVALQSSEVRPQVGGLIQRRLFTEGAVVRAGQPLFIIDPSLHRAEVREAEASLEAARATLQSAEELVERYRPLAEIEAVARQDYTNALASARAARAAVAQAGAVLETARINLRFTTVPAPISGRIGRTLATPGALATTGQAEPLAVIQQLDPMMVDIQQSATEILALRRVLASGGAEPTDAEVRLTLPDGSQYGPTGTVEASDVVVDPASGAVTLRARIPNPDGLLLPGMFVRASFAEASTRSAFLVPQQALSRTPQGDAFVFVVRPDNRVERRAVTTDRAQGAAWVVTSGLNPGERIVTQGLGQLRPDAQVQPVPASTPQRPRAAQTSAGR